MKSARQKRTTLRAPPLKRRQAKTFRTTGRRGLHDLLTLYDGLSGFNANTLGLTDYKTTYGEMTEAGIQILSDKFQTHAPVSKLPHKTFYDLGAGIGRIVVGLAILHPEIQSRGIEIVPDRARWANDALKRIKVPTVSSRIRFIQGSFLDPSVSFRDACWIFISNMCFDTETQTKTAKKLEEELPTGSVVICSRELPFSGKFVVLESNVNIPMTWSATSTCYVYKKN